jgi:hypothetical protein
VAEQAGTSASGVGSPSGTAAPEGPHIHALAKEFQLSVDEVLDLIAANGRLKMAVRGWVAEEHLLRKLRTIDGVTDCEPIRAERRPDVQLRFEGSRLLTVECKNVLRVQAKGGIPRMDFQRTRTSMGDPCSRYYSFNDFDVVAACLHPVTEEWEFRCALPTQLDPHKKCDGKLSNSVRIDDRWADDIRDVLRAAAGSSLV